MYREVSDSIVSPEVYPKPTKLQKGYWVSSENGRVIEIISIDGNKASVDTTGDGLGDNTDISDDELVKLAGLYEVGKTLWRVPLNHFSAIDCNWASDGSRSIVGCDKCKAPKLDKDEDKYTCKEVGSIIDVHKRTLGEVIPIAGTGFGLNYNSGRMKGFKSLNFIKSHKPNIDHEDFIDSKMELFIGEEPLPITGDGLLWNNINSYGRKTDDLTSAELKLTYNYRGKYMNPTDMQNSFNNLPSDTIINVERSNNVISLSASLNLVLNTDWVKEQKLGGWDFGFHNVLRKDFNYLYKGSGESVKDVKVSGNLKSFLDKDTVLGDSAYGDEDILYSPIFSTDGKGVYYYDLILEVKYYDFKTKKTKKLGNVRDIGGGKLVLKKGVLYAGGDNYRISKITPTESLMDINTEDRILSDYSCGEYRFNVDDFTINGDGDIYAVDTIKNVLIKVNQNGIVTELSGDCNNVDESNISSGDNGSVYDSKLNHPTKVLTDEDDNIYILEDSKIRKVDNQGIITTFINLSEGDKYIENIEVGDNFNDYVISNSDLLQFIIDQNNDFTFLYEDTIVKISKELTILESYKLDNDDNSKLGISLKGNGLVVTKFDLAEDYSASDFSEYSDFNGVPSKDGAFIYYFDEYGKHLKTVDTISRVELLNFKYNEDGYLISITDKDGNITRIERDSDNYGTKIIAPFGQETILNINHETGYLESLTLPGNRVYKMTYGDDSQDGLLLSFINPNNSTSVFEYNSLGQLIKDTNAEGEYKEIIEDELALYKKYKVKTKMGRTNTYETGFDEDKTWENSGPTGCKIKTTFRNEEKEIVKPNGMKTVIKEIPSPIFAGDRIKKVSEVTTFFPSGRKYFVTNKESINQDDRYNPLTIHEIKTTTKINNNREVSQIYNIDNRELTNISAMGRESKSFFNNQGMLRLSHQEGITNVEYKYDDKGRLEQIKQGDRKINYSYYTETGYLHTVTDNMDNTTEYIYDEAGRVINTRQTNEDNFEIEYDKNDNPIKVTPAIGKIHDFTYNKVDKVKTYESPEVESENNKTSYYYDEDGENISIETPDTKRINYKFQSQISIQSHTRNQCNCNYNQVTARLESVDYVAPQPPEGGVDSLIKTINYSYDEDKDQLTSISLDSSTVSYEYDGGLLLSEVSVSTVNPEIYPKPTKLQSSSDYNSKIIWDYDHDLRVDSINLSVNENNAITINYDYNDDNQLTKAGDVSYVYDNTTGFLTSKSMSNITETYAYNEVSDSDVNPVRLLKPTKLQYGEITSVNNGNHNFSYTYDEVSVSIVRQMLYPKPTKLPIGRIKTITNGSEVSEYFYDLMGRIEYVEVDGVEVSDTKVRQVLYPKPTKSQTERYTYDENGNRLTANGAISATYDLQDRMETYGDNTYTYTPNGSLLTKSNSEGITEYSYDAMGNLLRVNLPDGRVITYQIDARGRRIGKKINGVFQYGFIYGDQLNPIAKVDIDKNIIEQYVYGLKGYVPEYLIKGNNKYKIISNHLGSPVMVIDVIDNSVVKEIKYDSFGNILEDSAPNFDLPFRFAGSIWDKDTKLVRFGVRDYDSETGRWTSKELLC